MTYDPEIEKLLPWYAKGLLEADEQKQVDDYLTENPEMRMQLDLIAEEDLAVEQQHAALGAPAPGGLDRLLADIDALEAKEAPIVHAAAQASGLVEKFKGLFAGFSSPGMQFAGIAAALVIVAQGVIIGGLTMDGGKPEASKPGYTTASGPQDVVAFDGVKFLVAFNNEARMADVAALLKAQSAKIISGPKGGGFFEVAVSKDKLPEGGADAVLTALKEQPDLVKFASISK